jgi:hypothetical protein
MTKEQIKMGQRVLYRVDNENLHGIHEGVILEQTEDQAFVRMGYNWHKADHVTICATLPPRAELAAAGPPAEESGPTTHERIATALEKIGKAIAKSAGESNPRTRPSKESTGQVDETAKEPTKPEEPDPAKN